MASQLAETYLRKAVSVKSDEYYGNAQTLGGTAWRAFGGKSKSQVRNLENVANSATRVADILDFIKRQVGRSGAEKLWRYRNLGGDLLERIDQTLRADARSIYEDAKEKVKGHEMVEDDQRRVHILLCREFIRHVSAHYLYSIGISPEKTEGLKNIG